MTPIEGHNSSCSPDHLITAQSQLIGILSPLTEMSHEQAHVQFEQDQSDSHEAEEELTGEQVLFKDGPLSEGDVQATMEALAQDTLQ